MIEPVLVARRLALAADDERRARLVDEDRVDLVDDGVVEFALRVVERAELHVVAQVVEAELVVLAVGDVASVRDLLLVRRSASCTTVPDREAEERVDACPSTRRRGGEVVVDRDDVDALALERVQVAGERRDEGLALAGAHLGDAPVVQDHAADELHVVVAHLEGALARFAADGEGLGSRIVERRAVVELLLNSAVFARSSASVSFEMTGRGH